MTDERLKELWRLCAAATPGPWEHCGRNVVKSVSGPSVAITFSATVRRHENARFIAEARTAIPELLEEVRRLRFCLDHGLGEEDLHQSWSGSPPEPD